VSYEKHEKYEAVRGILNSIDNSKTDQRLKEIGEVIIEPLANKVQSVKEILYNTESLDEVFEKARKILEEMPEWQRRYADEIIEQALSKEESIFPRFLSR